MRNETKNPRLPAANKNNAFDTLRTAYNKLDELARGYSDWTYAVVVAPEAPCFRVIALPLAVELRKLKLVGLTSRDNILSLPN